MVQKSFDRQLRLVIYREFTMGFKPTSFRWFSRRISGKPSTAFLVSIQTPKNGLAILRKQIHPLIMFQSILTSKLLILRTNTPVPAISLVATQTFFDFCTPEIFASDFHFYVIAIFFQMGGEKPPRIQTQTRNGLPVSKTPGPFLFSGGPEAIKLVGHWVRTHVGWVRGTQRWRWLLKGCAEAGECGTNACFSLCFFLSFFFLRGMIWCWDFFEVDMWCVFFEVSCWW